MHRFTFSRFAIGLFISPLLMALVGAAPTARAEEILVLPSFVVEETKEAIKWRYIAHRDFEILARCSDVAATTFAAQLPLGLAIADLLVPAKLRPHLDPPLLIILDTPKPLEANPYVQVPRSADQDCFAFYQIWSSSQLGNRELTMAKSTGSLFAFSMYLSLALDHRASLAPTWLRDSVDRQLYQMAVEGRDLKVFALHLKEPDENTRIPALMPLQAMGRILNTNPRRRAQPTALTEELRLAEYTGQLLVNWALFSENGKYRDRFWEFYFRAGTTPDAGEALFRECLGLSYAQALGLMQKHRAKAADSLFVSFKSALSQLSPVTEIRDASPAEVARMTGEWLRVRVASANPIPPAKNKSAPAPSGTSTSSFAQEKFSRKDEFLSASGRAYQRGMAAMPHDPKLLASAGIFLAELGRDSAALPLLEEAANASVTRARVHFEIARIRLAAGVSEAVEKKLSVAQFASVAEPLRQGYSHSMDQEQYYDLLAALWETAPTAPTRPDLAPLLATPLLFPRQPSLILRAAQLHANQAFTSEAQNLCQAGLALSTDDKSRSEFSSLLSRVSSKAAAPSAGQRP